MFKFQAVIDDVESIPEEYRELYEEQDGAQVLKMDLMQNHPAYKTVKSTADKMDREKKAVKKQLAEMQEKLSQIPEDFDPSAYQTMVDELAELREAVEAGDDGKKGGKDKKEIPSQIKALESKMNRAATEAQAEIKKRDDRIGTLAGKLERVLIDDGLTKSLIEAGIDPKFLKASKAMLRDLVTLREEDDDFEAIVETDAGEQSLSDFVKDWAGTDEGKLFIKPASGSGSEGGGKGSNIEGNPFKKETANVTEQGRIVRDDPEKARRLMKAAGWVEARIESYLR